jgi:hypothetical protein
MLSPYLWSILPVYLLLTSLVLNPCCPNDGGVNHFYRDGYFKESGGIVAVEAEHFDAQANDAVRRWYLIQEDAEISSLSDHDGNHAVTASGGAYLEVLPDTRTNHSDTLIHHENFCNQPGEMAVLSYRVYFENTGRFFVWVRAYSTGTEDNGIHVGIDGSWPTSGRRMQWCEGKNQWTWESKQRTDQDHCGVPQLIYLDVVTPGLHTISFSMREDGFEFDKWVMATTYVKPQKYGPEEVLLSH